MGLWDVRWWDGHGWHEAVRTGSHQDVEPLADIAELIANAPGDGVVWQGKRGVDAVGSEHYILTGKALRLYTNLANPPRSEWELWTIAKADARVNAGQSLAHIGDVVLTINYAGFAGRTTEVLKNVPEPARVAAMISRLARLARRVAGYPEPEIPSL
jgi:hypothetical protein